MVLPAFGPNNQYYALKETLVAAWVLGRRLVLPAFYHHRYVGKGATYPFESTFDPAPFVRHVPTQSLAEFRAQCAGQLTLLYLHPQHPDWDLRQSLYLTENGLGTPKEVVYPGTPSRPFALVRMQGAEGVRAFFQGYLDRPCLALGFPFRNLGGDLLPRINAASCLFQPAPTIDRLADLVLGELGLRAEHFFGVHWRESEVRPPRRPLRPPPDAEQEGCQLESPSQHAGYEVCLGTSSYVWARLVDLKALLRDTLLTGGLGQGGALFLATDTAEVHLVGALRQTLPGLRVARDSPTLRGMRDSYLRSLVEQAVLMRARQFLGTGGSTWSQSIAAWWGQRAFKKEGGATYLEAALQQRGAPTLQHTNGDEWVRVGGEELPTLRRYLTSLDPPPPDCHLYPPWLLCGPPGPLLLVQTDEEGEGGGATLLPLARLLLKGPWSPLLLAPGLKAQDLDPLVPHSPPSLGKGDYGSVLRLGSWLSQHPPSGGRVSLVLDLGARSLPTLQVARLEGHLAPVGSVTLRAELAPLWQADRLHWSKELHARAALLLGELRALAGAGLPLVHAQVDPEAKDESTWILTLRRNITPPPQP